MLVGSAMFGGTFNLCRITIIFGTPKGNTQKINSLPLNDDFSMQQNVFQNGANAFVENSFKIFIFCQKAENFVHIGEYDLVQISPACCSSTYQIMYGET